MGKVLVGVIAVLGSLMLVDSLTCKSCPFGLAGFCLFPTTVTCQSNTSQCYTSIATFPSLPSFKGFNSAGCLDDTISCGTNTSFNLLKANITIQTACCSTDNCNSAAPPSTSTTVSAVLAVAAAASLWGSML